MKVKRGYTAVDENSTIGQLLKLTMRNQGVTAHESMEELNVRLNYANCTINYLINMCGYDIRSFPAARDRRLSNWPCNVYCCVGRYNWDGTYEDYLTTTRTSNRT